MKQEHKQYISENKDRMPVEEMARHLNIRERNVRKFLKQEEEKNKMPEELVAPASSFGKNRVILCIVIIVLTGLAVYGNSLNGQFIWDDNH